MLHILKNNVARLSALSCSYNLVKLLYFYFFSFSEQQFLVQIAHVPAKSKLPCGPARLHLQDHTFCIVSGVPPRLLGTWPIKELRRFGVIEGKFCFEGGSLCGKGKTAKP